MSPVPFRKAVDVRKPFPALIILEQLDLRWARDLSADQWSGCVLSRPFRSRTSRVRYLSVLEFGPITLPNWRIRCATPYEFA